MVSPVLSSLTSEVAVRVLVGGDVIVDRAHHLPGAGHLHVAGMLLHREPPPGDRHARHHVVAVAVLLRPLLHPDIHQGQLVALGLEPEIDGVLLLRRVLVVEDDVGEPAIAFHAAHALDLLEDEIEVGVELGIVEHEGAVLRPLGDHLSHPLIDVLLGELLRAGGFRGLLGGEEVLRLLDVAGRVLEEGLLRGLGREAIDVSVGVGPIHRAVGLDRLAGGETHGALIVELAFDRCRRHRLACGGGVLGRGGGEPPRAEGGGNDRGACRQDEESIRREFVIALFSLDVFWGLQFC